MNPKDIQKRIENALNQFFVNDQYLVEQNLSERSISHHLARYLHDEFPDWHVDCEYNRNFDRVKILEIDVPDTNPEETEARTVYPDIIVHRRGTAENLAVLEVKKSNNQDSGEYDLRKLEAFRQNLGYRFTYFVMIDVEEISYTINIQ